MKFLKNKKGSQLVEKIMMVAFAVAAGAAVIVYSAGVITQSKTISPDAANNILDGTPEAHLNSFVANGTTSSITSLHGDISGEGSNLTVTNVKMRFGAKIQQSDWQAIQDKWTIANYGVLLVKENTLLNTYNLSSVKEAYYAGKNLKDSRASGTPYAENGYYIFTVAMNMTDATSSGYERVYCAAPFLVSNEGEMLFLPEIRQSVKTLAQKTLSENDFSSISREGLEYLINF